jgi:Tfp pilus assembly protein FimT
MVLYFYDSSQQLSKDQSAQIHKALTGSRGLADLVSFDVGKYAVTSPQGAIAIKPGLAKDQTSKQAAVLSQSIGVKYTPFIVIVDNQGYITYKSRGYTDGAVIEREVLRASR